jgi:hypothetical protein
MGNIYQCSTLPLTPEPAEVNGLRRTFSRRVMNSGPIVPRVLKTAIFQNPVISIAKLKLYRAVLVLGHARLTV